MVGGWGQGTKKVQNFQKGGRAFIDRKGKQKGRAFNKGTRGLKSLPEKKIVCNATNHEEGGLTKSGAASSSKNVVLESK